MRKFAAFILTHGRPDNVVTYKTLRACGYTGDVFFVVDNEDATADRYRANFGAERVIVFDKKEQADKIDEANNFDNRNVIVHARNASFDIAETLGVTHFVQLDDDYNSFLYRTGEGVRVGDVRPSASKSIADMDKVFDALLDFFDETPTQTLAISQGGDHLGGFTGLRLSRKAMNFFVCSVARRFQFLGAINEDVNTYTRLATVGGLFFSFMGLQLNQQQTQAQAGGMTEVYLKQGTYVKSFTSVLFCPSSVRVAMMGNKFPRMHHTIDWGATCPKIVPHHIRRLDP